MAVSTHTFQAPKGTRDFYPHDLAVRRYIESVWREVSINHGFDEIDGPTFEHLDLYTIKSGPGIESELFSFTRSGGDTKYALRPEFTPTLARMYAAQAGSLAKPTKWFSIGPFFRAERPQRGRLREHIQLNVDIVGDDNSSRADAEVIAVAVAVLDRFGLTPKDVRIKIGHREVLSDLCRRLGYNDNELPKIFSILDKRDKLDDSGLQREADKAGVEWQPLCAFKKFLAVSSPNQIKDFATKTFNVTVSDPTDLLSTEWYLDRLGISEWCEYDLGIVRGLAYYTGAVFEIHEVGGRERAIAGGGRYNNLVELLGGPATAAVGVAMGDVVIRLVLQDKRLLEAVLERSMRPDVFLIAAKDEVIDQLYPLSSKLRSVGLHVRHSYKATRNVGKLMSEANKARARFAVILGKELDEGNIVLKDLRSGEQEEIARETLIEVLRIKLAACEGG
ncbi:MAG: histidine--tRNA ligase [Planctomycetes bacterium]|nr:histidine--tRNA ligase [Planctomycetota bacterium]